MSGLKMKKNNEISKRENVLIDFKVIRCINNVAK